jgi:hypothetical protein
MWKFCREMDHQQSLIINWGVFDIPHTPNLNHVPCPVLGERSVLIIFNIYIFFWIWQKLETVLARWNIHFNCIRFVQFLLLVYFFFFYIRWRRHRINRYLYLYVCFIISIHKLTDFTLQPIESGFFLFCYA